jgi:iron complex outermembrane receptor protein
MKSELLQKRLVINAAVFFADWKNKQVNRTVIQDFNGNGIIDFVTAPADREFLGVNAANAGDLHVYGLDLDATYSPIDNLVLALNLSYAHSDIKNEFDDDYFKLTGKLSAAGQQPALVPEWSASGSATYRHPVSDTATGFVRGDVSYIGKRYADLTNTAYIGAKTRVNLRTGAEWKQVTVSAYVDNLFNNKEFESVFAQGDSVSDPFTFGPKAYEVGLPRPRSYGVTAEFRF